MNGISCCFLRIYIRFNRNAFLSTRKRQLALLVIVWLLLIKSLIKSNYPKSTPNFKHFFSFSDLLLDCPLDALLGAP